MNHQPRIPGAERIIHRLAKVVNPFPQAKRPAQLDHVNFRPSANIDLHSQFLSAMIADAGLGKRTIR